MIELIKTILFFFYFSEATVVCKQQVIDALQKSQDELAIEHYRSNYSSEESARQSAKKLPKVTVRKPRYFRPYTKYTLVIGYRRNFRSKCGFVFGCGPAYTAIQKCKIHVLNKQTCELKINSCDWAN